MVQYSEPEYFYENQVNWENTRSTKDCDGLCQYGTQILYKYQEHYHSKSYISDENGEEYEALLTSQMSSLQKEVSSPKDANVINNYPSEEFEIIR